MPITPEDRARENIDRLLSDAGWIVQDKRSTNLSAGVRRGAMRGVEVHIAGKNQDRLDGQLPEL